MKFPDNTLVTRKWENCVCFEIRYPFKNIACDILPRKNALNETTGAKSGKKKKKERKLYRNIFLEISRWQAEDKCTCSPPRKNREGCYRLSKKGEDHEQTPWMNSDARCIHSYVHRGGIARLPISRCFRWQFNPRANHETVDLSRRNRLTRYLFCPPVPERAPVPATTTPNAIHRTFNSG